jgi:glycine cleavage system P protein (glycine dehydrogenase) subunit 1
MSYVSNSDDERRAMLKSIGVSDFTELINEIPTELRLNCPLNLPVGKPELEVIQTLREIASMNKSSSELISFLGGGAYEHYIPAAVDALISRSEFFTAYTPYQAEVSQGTLQTIYEFQSLVCRLTGMDIANASMYDGASAAAESVLLSLSQTRNKKIYLSAGLHPSYRDVIETYTSGMDVEFHTLPSDGEMIDHNSLIEIDFDSAACVLVQSPNFFGAIEEIKRVGDLVADKKCLYIIVSNPISLSLLVPPGEAGADLAVGEMQVFGNNLNFGGPNVGYFAANKKYLRKIPGRLVAITKDVDGRTGYVLTLQTREQHIRRNKATSNICTNEALCALAATIHLTLVGESGLREAAGESVKRAHYLAEKLSAIQGFELINTGKYFNEFVIKLPIPSSDYLNFMEKEGILAGVALEYFYPNKKDQILVAVTEKRSKADLDKYIEATEKILQSKHIGVN